ncbi:hypothetical protein C7C46_16735 [Streptomyces tateyamensis]|uniref:Proteinase inhibitor I42 chagasin domain-containing protein n=1 Tax=Streptomyces tateyamensis TaxID=565073 RepID=A0A2V4P4Y3_9ACTN|nr:hypothetical protein [Streptomyces tateyamensis]PYC77991.1 hypothetical protein C7C46_16735 [Streptomyces tateyamensis]
MRPQRIVPCAAALAALFTLASCGSSAPSASVSVSSSPSSPVAVSPPLGLDEHANGTTVRVAAGGTVVVTLHSAYWSALTSSAPAVLAPAGSPSTSPGTCPPGGGCGTVTAVFRASSPGTAQLTASRTSCGEALACAPDQRSYQVTVTVSG